MTTTYVAHVIFDKDNYDSYQGLVIDKHSSETDFVEQDSGNLFATVNVKSSPHSYFFSGEEGFEQDFSLLEIELENLERLGKEVFYSDILKRYLDEG